MNSSAKPATPGSPLQAHTPEAAGEAILHLPLEAIRPNPHQPRRQFREEQIATLAASIAHQGVLLPLIVRPHPHAPESYELVAGERRLRALQYLGRSHTPAVLRQVADDALLEMALVENLQREPLTPIEEAQAYRALMDAHGYTQERLAARLGKDRSTIANLVRLLSLPPGIQTDVEAERLSVGHARALLGCGDPVRMVMLRDLILARDLSVRDTERLLRADHLRQNRTLTDKHEVAPTAADGDRVNVQYEAAREELERALGTRVTFHRQGPGGRMEIDFYSLDDFNRLYDLLTGK